MAGLWISTNCAALAASAVRWRIEQAEEFREEVEGYTDSNESSWPTPSRRCCATGHCPTPSSPLVIHRFRDPRTGDAYVLRLPTIVVG